MANIKGIEVTLWTKVQTGTDAFNQAIYTETPVTVSNVLVQTCLFSGRKYVTYLSILE